MIFINIGSNLNSQDGDRIFNIKKAIDLICSEKIKIVKKSSIYDFDGWDTAKATSGRVVQTTFAKASAAVSNRSDGSYDLVIRRSFADYVAQWLLDAGGEFGCRIEQG